MTRDRGIRRCTAVHRGSNHLRGARDPRVRRRCVEPDGPVGAPAVGGDMGHRMLWTATTLLVLEAASVAWAWPHVERWAEAPGLEAWTRTGERIAGRAGTAARSVALRVVERASHRVLDGTRGWWSWVGEDAPAVTRSAARNRMIM